jgi:hypothetical protein
VTLEPITVAGLGTLIDGKLRRAEAAGVRWIREPAAFQAHLVAVARRAVSVAHRLNDVLPADEAPDPVAVFVAAAWHDGGKIWFGDDYHEIASAIDVIDNGVRWGLVKGPPTEVAAVLGRAARAILPHFALSEQWHADYVPTRGERRWFEPMYRRLAERFSRWPLPTDDRRDLLLPAAVDALVVMYSDMAPVPSGQRRRLPFSVGFEGRWREVEHRAAMDDPAILRILPVVRPRIYAGCALIDRFLAEGFDREALQRFREAYCGRRVSFPAVSS